MVLLIDNYDSFSYNLYQLIGSIIRKKEEICVIRNDAYSVEEIEKMQPTQIIISPGPGRPHQAGICEELIQSVNGKIPILGVCLGHQAICEALGGTITYAKQLMHGKQTQMEILDADTIFCGLDESIQVARYHSLVAEEERLPKSLSVIGRATDGEVMAVAEKNGMTFGLQFHPESIMTPDGKRMMENFLGRSL